MVINSVIAEIGSSLDLSNGLDLGTTEPSSPSESGLWIKGIDSISGGVAISGGLTYDNAYYTKVTSIQYPPDTFLASSSTYYVDVGGGVYNGKYYFIVFPTLNIFNATNAILFSYDLTSHQYENLSSVFSIDVYTSSYGTCFCAAALCNGKLIVATNQYYDSDGSQSGSKNAHLWSINLSSMSYSELSLEYGDGWGVMAMFPCNYRACADEINNLVYFYPVLKGNYDRDNDNRIIIVNPNSGYIGTKNIPDDLQVDTSSSRNNDMRAIMTMITTDSGIFAFGNGYNNNSIKGYKITSLTDDSSWQEIASHPEGNNHGVSAAIWLGGRDIYCFIDGIYYTTTSTKLYKYNIDSNSYTLIVDLGETLCNVVDSYAKMINLAIDGNEAWLLTNQNQPSAAMPVIRFNFDLSYPYPEDSIVISISNTKNRAVLSTNPIIETGIRKVYHYSDGKLTEVEAYTWDEDGGWLAV